MTSLVVLLLAVAPVKLAAPGVTCVGLEPGLCEAYLEHFVSVLSADGRVHVTTAKDIAQVLGLERQRQLLGCDEASSCVAEFAGALGVDGLVTSTLARTESGFLATLRVLRSSDGSVWLQASERLSSDAALQAWLEDQAERFASELSPRGATSPVVRWVPAIVGGACLVAGGVLFGWSKADAAQLHDTSNGLTDDQLAAIASRGQVTQPLGAVLMGVGAAGLAASLLWVALAPGAPAHVTLAPAPGGAALVVGGPLP